MLDDFIFKKPKVNHDIYIDILEDEKHKFLEIDGVYFLEINADRCSEKVIIYNNGRGGCISDNFETMKNISEKTGIPVIIYDYPGYGISSGDCCEGTWVNMLYRLIQYEERHSKRKIILSGFSLGSCVIISLLAKYKHCRFNIDFIMLISTPKSLGRIVSDSYLCDSICGIFGYDYFRNIDRIHHLSKYRIKFIHGKDDDIVPPIHTSALYKEIDNDRKIKIIEGRHVCITRTINPEEFKEF